LERVERRKGDALKRLAALALTLVALAATPSPSPRPSPTPNPYRAIELASPTLDRATQGEIEILGGWAAVKRDGKGAVVCISFKNEAAVAVTQVVFEFTLIGRSGETLGKLDLDRRGTFSPGVAIDGWRSLSDWQSGLGHRGYNDNCKTIERAMAAVPLLSVRSMAYRITRVESADGKTWTP
jgi:hypothetical protein